MKSMEQVLFNPVGLLQHKDGSFPTSIIKSEAMYPNLLEGLVYSSSFDIWVDSNSIKHFGSK